MSDSPEDVKMVPRFDDASEGGDELMEAMGIDPKDGDGGTGGKLTESAETATDASIPSSGQESGTSDTAPSIPEREFYKCKKGHITEDMWAHVARENAQGGEIIEDSGPICRRCFVRWIAKMFPAKRCAAPKELAVA